MILSQRLASLGRTGIIAGRMGIASSYGPLPGSVEKAFEHGVNYFYWGSMRRDAFGAGIRNLAAKRDRFTLVLQSYTRLAPLLRWSVERGLKRLATEFADVLLLGFWNGSEVPERILDAALELRDRKLVRTIGVSTHNRRLAAELARHREIGILHVRYNAVHTGAESDVFARLGADRPGIVSFTATCWRQLIDPRRMPKGERVPTAADCYRFVLSNPDVDVCMSGPAAPEQLDACLEALDKGPLSADEVLWMRRVGDAIYGRPRLASSASR